MSKKTTKKTTKEIEKKDLTPKNIEMWGGVFSSKELEGQTRVLLLKVSQIYNVPPSGVNLMAGQPYLNKEARLILLHRHRKVKSMRTLFLQVSTKPEDSAICCQRIVFEDDRIIEAIGEASQDNVSLRAVKATLNMMAETRALNRAIWKDIAGDVWAEALKNLEEMQLTDDERQAVEEAGRVSAEELSGDYVSDKQNKKYFEKAVDMLSRSAPTMSTEEKEKTEEKIQNSDLYTKDQKKELTEILYAD